MDHFAPPIGYIVVLNDDEDVLKLDAAIEADKVGYQKLGARTYLGFLYEEPRQIHFELKRDFGIFGQIHWMTLGRIHETT